MATTIRLTRMGRKKRPFYRLVVLDSRKRRDGAYLANLGYYNPFTDPHEVELHAGEIIDWLGKGATVSDTAKSLLRSEGVLYQFSLVKQGLEEADVEARMAEWHQNAEKRQQEREAAQEARKETERKAREAAEAEAKAEAEKVEAEKAAAEKAEADKAAAEAAAAAAAEAAAAAAAEAAEAAETAEPEGEAEAPVEEAAAEADEKKDAGGEGDS